MDIWTSPQMHPHLDVKIQHFNVLPPRNVLPVEVSSVRPGHRYLSCRCRGGSTLCSFSSHPRGFFSSIVL